MIQVEEVHANGQLNEFIEFPWKVYTANSPWVPPLRRQLRVKLNEKRHPFYRHARKSLFVARKSGGQTVGRIAGFVDDAHNQFHEERAAFFGFFESFDDPDVASALVATVTRWAEAQGSHVLRGPFNLNSNYESGLLVDGFGDQPVVGMTYNPDYYERLLLGAGFAKLKDLYAYAFSRRSEAPATIQRHFDKLKSTRGITLRTLDRRALDRDIELAFGVYNDAWQKNWGFIPLDLEEFRFIIKEVKSLVDPSLIMFAEVDGETAGVSLALPDYNKALKRLRNGKLFPAGLIRLLWYLKGPRCRRTVDRFRIAALGVKKKFDALGIGALLYLDYFQRGKELGYRSCECSWVLEDNLAMNRALQMMGAKRRKTYRIYERGLTYGLESLPAAPRTDEVTGLSLAPQTSVRIRCTGVARQYGYVRGHCLLTRMTNRNQVQRYFVIRQSENLADPVVVERSNGHTAQVQGYCLQQQILRGVPDFHVDIGFGAIAILASRSRVDCRNHEHRWGLAYCVLGQSRSVERLPEVFAVALRQLMSRRFEVVESRRFSHVHFQRIQGARRGCRSQPIRFSDSLRRP